jgi:hypothetical protein
VTGIYPFEQIETAFQGFSGAKDRKIKMLIDPWM